MGTLSISLGIVLCVLIISAVFTTCLCYARKGHESTDNRVEVQYLDEELNEYSPLAGSPLPFGDASDIENQEREKEKLIGDPVT